MPDTLLPSADDDGAAAAGADFLGGRPVVGRPILVPAWALETGEHEGVPARRKRFELSPPTKVALVAIALNALVPAALGVYLIDALFRKVNLFRLVHHTYATLTLAWPVILAASAVAVGIVAWRWRGREGQHRLRWTALGLAGLGAGLLGLRIYATEIEPYRLQIREVTIASPKVRQPLRILHLSDIQTPRVGPYEERVVETIQRLHPDLIIHTGDLLQPVAPATLASELPKLRTLLDRLDPPLGKFDVMGDVDRAEQSALRQHEFGLKLLESDEVRVTAPDGTRLRLLGLTLEQSRFPGFGEIPIRNWFEKVDPAEFSIVFGHAPDYVCSVEDLPIDLCLAGHTHGGQIRLPIWGPLVWASEIPRRWARGYHEVGATRINVSAGVGAEHAYGLPSIRFLCPPEMTLITLVPAEP